MNPFEMVVIIVFLSVVGSVLNNWLKGRDDKKVTSSEDALADELRAQIVELEDRVRVLERIVTDTSGREELHRQFRELERS